MLILLPPSESKTARARGVAMAPADLSFAGLAPARARVADALAAVSARPDAGEVLGVAAGLAGEVARNTRLGTAPAVRAGALYTGVLYDALGYRNLDPAARRRANRWLVILSALYGAVRPTDAIAPYRLSMGVNLPGVGPLAAFWREALTQVLPGAAGRGVIVDCRSSTYAAAWTPSGELASRWVQVRVPGATHLAKHTRGLVARHLCVHGAGARSVEAVTGLIGEAFDIALAPPARPGRPWVLDVTAPVDGAGGGVGEQR